MAMFKEIKRRQNADASKYPLPVSSLRAINHALSTITTPEKAPSNTKGPLSLLDSLIETDWKNLHALKVLGAIRRADTDDSGEGYRNSRHRQSRQ